MKNVSDFEKSKNLRNKKGRKTSGVKRVKQKIVASSTRHRPVVFRSLRCHFAAQTKSNTARAILR